MKNLISFLAFNIPSKYHVNPFEKDFIINPKSKELTPQQQKVCLIASIVVGVFSLGIYHLVQVVKKNINSREVKFKAVKIGNDKIIHVRPTKDWKTIPGAQKMPDFSYVKPQVNLSSLKEAPSSVKLKVEQRCLEKMKEAMKVLDPSIVDATTELMANTDHSEFLQIVDTFSSRILDIYKAYVKIQIENHTPALPMDIGVMKATGFTHEQLLDLFESCQWYENIIENFDNELIKEGLDKQETQILLENIINNKYKWTNKKDQDLNNNLRTVAPEIYQLLNKYKSQLDVINNSCNKLIEKLNQNNKFFIQIKEIDYRLDFVKTINQSEKEYYKKTISQLKPIQNNDSRLRLLHEIQSRFELREFETGAVGTPLRLLNILEGKYDKDQSIQFFKNKLFFCYGSKGMINEVCQSSQMIKLINEKLKEEKKDWQIDEKLADQLSKPWKQPVYRLGIYANENNIGNKMRHYLSPQEVQQNEVKDPNLTYAEAEKIVKKENLKEQDLNKRFRMNLSEQEEISTFGTNRSLEKKELERRLANSNTFNDTNPPHPVKTYQADTHFLESNLDYQKKTQKIRWQPGKHFFKLHTQDLCKSPYLNAIEALGLPQYSGISGSTDQTFTMAGILGIQAKEDLINLRLAYMPWMSGQEDHTVDEIMTATKAFGLEYCPSADYYKQIIPENESFISALQKAQHARGYELPDYYLSKEYAESIYQEEMKNQIELEAKKNEEVNHLLINHQLLIQTQSIYRNDYSISDIFGDSKWKKNLTHLKTTNLEKKNQQRIAKRNKQSSKSSKSIKYILNFQTEKYEPYIPSTIPFYKGTAKTSVSLLPSTGKITPYVEEKFPDLNRVGLLFDSNDCEFKKEKFVFRKDANTLGQKKWKKFYDINEVDQAGFQNKLQMESEEAVKFSQEKAGKVSMDELVHQLEANKDSFAPYNEILASVKGTSIKGVFIFSKGLPTNQERIDFENSAELSDWPPLYAESKIKFQENEDYDRYMRILGIGKRIATKEELGIDVPLYEINKTTNTGLSLITIEDQIKLIKEILKDDQKSNGIIRIIERQGDIQASSKNLKKHLNSTLKRYLQAL